jgi:Domain of unknown function (DUF4386)
MSIVDTDNYVSKRPKNMNITGDEHMNTTSQAAVIEENKHMNAYRQTISKGDQHMNTTRNQHMNTHRQAAIIVGILFIIASVTAILGLLLYTPILTGPDYLVNGAENSTRVIVGALMEFILACTAIGTAIGLFPVLKSYGERIAVGHLLFRFFEAVVITVGIIAVLSLLTLSQDFVAAGALDASAYHASGTLLHAVYKWTSMFGPLFLLGINTMMYSYLLFKSKLVPRLLALMGLTGAALVLGYAMLVMFGVVIHGSGPATLMVAPIAFYEMILAMWLIVKGFNPTAIAAEPVQTTANDLLSAA